MTKDEALKMAIEALDWELGGEPLPTLMEQARKACKEALEQPSAQEPIGYIGVMTLQRIKSNYSGIDGYGISLKKLLENDISLYTHPAPPCQECKNLKHDLDGYMEANKALINREWVGLSDDEILQKAAQIVVERHYKEKNNVM